MTPAVVSAPPPAQLADRGPASVARRHRWVSTPVATPPDASRSQLEGRTLAVLGGREPLAQAVCSLAGQLGARTRQVRALGGLTDEEWPAVAGELGEGVDAVVDLGGEELLGQPGTGPGAWWPGLARTWAVVRELQAAWQGQHRADSTAYLTVTRTGGHCGTRPGPVPAPYGGLWAGFAKGLPHELPTTRVRVLDLDAADAQVQARTILRELVTGGPVEIGYAAGVRHHLRAVQTPVPAPVWDLDASHLVLTTGGGRGIGWAMAEHLARATGATVVVTGRDALLADDDPWLDPTLVPQLRTEELRQAGRRGELAAGRLRVLRLAERAEVSVRVRAAVAAGLPVRYERADVTDPAAVADLVGRLPRLPDLVLHNAGVDRPGRLRDKHPATVRTTVAVKLEGFRLLRDALQRAGARPRVWCNIGSMTGRWGGLLGQLEYGAANEALARLGLWAEHDPMAPSLAATTLTVAWPTWERLGGLISNFDAAVRHMGAMPVQEGLRHWQAELAAAQGGETGYLAPLGADLPPSLIRAYGQPALPVARDLGTHVLLLSGDYTSAPGLFTARLHLDAADWPVAQDVTYAGAPMLPLAWALELAWAASGWVLPDPSRPTGLRDVRARPAALALGANPRAVEVSCRLVTELARPGASGPAVEVTLTVAGQVALTLSRVELRDSDLLSPAPASRPPADPPADSPAQPRTLLPADPRTVPPAEPLAWHGAVLPAPVWTLDDQGAAQAQVVEPDPRSQCLLEPLPRTVLPVGALEAAVALAVAQLAVGTPGPPGPPGPRLLSIPAVDLAVPPDRAAPPVAGAVGAGGCVVRRQGSTTSVLDTAGTALLRLHGLHLTRDTDHPFPSTRGAS